MHASRKVLFRKATEFDETFYHQDDFEKYTLLVSNLQKPVTKFLTSAMALRTKILTISN